MLKVAQINLSDIAWYEVMLFENSLLIIRATPCRCKPSFLPAWSITEFWCSKARILGILPLYFLISAVNYDNCMTHIFQFSYFCYEQLEDWERQWCGDYCW